MSRADVGIMDLGSTIALARAMPRQPAVPWPRDRWIEAFPEQRSMIDALPDVLTRADIRAVYRECPATPRGATDAFIAAMAWGYADTGYGVYRTRTILEEGGIDVGLQLAHARRLARDAGALAGYEYLASNGRIHRLGPAFGTKFLYFENQCALILDKLIADWFQAITAKDLRPTQWRPGEYEAYLVAMNEWAQQAGILSQAGFRGERSSWIPSHLRGRSFSRSWVA